MRRVLFVLLLLAGAGCGTEPEQQAAPAGLPPNDTPQHAIQRLIGVYEQREYEEFAALLTGDFRFEFSELDPFLKQQWPEGWTAAEEESAAWHLFRGGRTAFGADVDAATSVDLRFASTLPVGETGRDTTFFKALATPVDGEIFVPNRYDPGNPTRFLIMGNSHRFFLVRGDSAQGLAAGQPADSTRWYIRRWRDESQQLGAPAGLKTSTWGSIKAAYR